MLSGTIRFCWVAGAPASPTPKVVVFEHSSHTATWMRASSSRLWSMPLQPVPARPKMERREDPT